MLSQQEASNPIINFSSITLQIHVTLQNLKTFLQLLPVEWDITVAHTLLQQAKREYYELGFEKSSILG